MAAEIDALTKSVQDAEHPLMAIVGGSKVSTKLTILNNLAKTVDQLIVGGGIANTFLLAAGKKIGKSLAEPELVDECKKVLATLAEKGANLPLPTDVVVAKAFAADAEHRTCSVDDVADDEMILDVGPETAEELAKLVKASKTIVWNGPVGVFEMEPYAGGTKALAAAIADATKAGAFSIAGGGDTVSAVHAFGVADKVSYISNSWKVRRCRPWPFWKKKRRLDRSALKKPSGTDIFPGGFFRRVKKVPPDATVVWV